MLATAVSFFAIQSLIALFCAGLLFFVLGILIGGMFFRGHRRRAQRIEVQNQTLRAEVAQLEQQCRKLEARS